MHGVETLDGGTPRCATIQCARDIQGTEEGRITAGFWYRIVEDILDSSGNGIPKKWWRRKYFHQDVPDARVMVEASSGPVISARSRDPQVIRPISSHVASVEFDGPNKHLTPLTLSRIASRLTPPTLYSGRFCSPRKKSPSSSWKPAVEIHAPPMSFPIASGSLNARNIHERYWRVYTRLEPCVRFRGRVVLELGEGLR